MGTETESPYLTSTAIDWYKSTHSQLKYYTPQKCYFLNSKYVLVYLFFSLHFFLCLCVAHRCGTLSFRRKQVCKILITPPSFIPDWSSWQRYNHPPSPLYLPSGASLFGCPLPHSRAECRVSNTAVPMELAEIQSLAKGHFNITWTFLYSLSPCYSRASTKGVSNSFTYCRRKHTYTLETL